MQTITANGARWCGWLVLLLLSLLLIPTHCLVIPANFSADLDAFVACLMTTNAVPLGRRTPEAIVTVVANGAVVLARGYGQDGNGQPITNRTLFGIGSVSKAFTSTLMGLWQEKGRVDPLRPIHEYAPGVLKSYDASIDRQATLRDLFSHRTGIANSNFLWLISDPLLDWREAVRQIVPGLPPAVPFRSDFEYSNFLTAQAAAVVEQVGGSPWEAQLQSMIFTPLGMLDTVSSAREARLSGKMATPYMGGATASSPVQRLPDDADDIDDVVKPAGSIFTTASDMSAWMLLHLGHNPTFLNASTLDALHTPQSLMPFIPSVYQQPGSALGAFTDVVVGYAYNWWEGGLMGHKYIRHTGSVVGWGADLLLFPLDDFGVFVSTPLVSGATNAFVTLWVALTLLGEHNFVADVCRTSADLHSNRSLSAEADRLVERWSSLLPDAHWARGGSPARGLSANVIDFSARSDTAVSRSVAQVDPASMAGVYRSNNAFGSITLFPSGNSSWPLLMEWMQLRALLQPRSNGSATFDAQMSAPPLLTYNGGRWSALLTVRVGDRGEVLGLDVIVSQGAGLVFFAAASAEVWSSSTGSSGPAGGGGDLSGSSTPWIVVVSLLCLGLTVCTLYALWVTWRYRTLKGEGGSRSQLSEALLA